MDDRSPEAVFAEFVVESWRFARDYGRVVAKLDANEQARFANKLHYYLQRLNSFLEQVGMRVVSLENHPFDIGLPADVLNLDEFSTNDSLIIDQVLEPIIIGRDGNVLRTGKVMVRKAAQ